MATVRLDTDSDATWARAWSVDNAAGRTALLATFSDPLGPKRGDVIFQVDTAVYYVVVTANTIQQISDIDYLSQAQSITAQKTFTAVRGVLLQRNQPALELWDSSQAADARSILVANGVNTGGDFEVLTSDDAHSVLTSILTLTRATGALTAGGFTATSQNGIGRVVSIAFTVANAGLLSLGTSSRQGFLFALDTTNGDYAIFTLRGGVQNTQEIADPSGVFSVTAGTGASTNIYWSAGNTRYELQNNTGGSVDYRFLSIGV